jgi:hypothetical protein
MKIPIRSQYKIPEDIAKFFTLLEENADFERLVWTARGYFGIKPDKLLEPAAISKNEEVLFSKAFEARPNQLTYFEQIRSGSKQEREKAMMKMYLKAFEISDKFNLPASLIWQLKDFIEYGYVEFTEQEEPFVLHVDMDTMFALDKLGRSPQRMDEDMAARYINSPMGVSITITANVFRKGKSGVNALKQWIDKCSDEIQYLVECMELPRYDITTEDFEFYQTVKHLKEAGLQYDQIANELGKDLYEELNESADNKEIDNETYAKKKRKLDAQYNEESIKKVLHKRLKMSEKLLKQE